VPWLMKKLGNVLTTIFVVAIRSEFEPETVAAGRRGLLKGGTFHVAAHKGNVKGSSQDRGLKISLVRST
jgi:hypothetical protein